ncbi:MAG: response regulator [Phycisphaerales bacterium]
MNDQTVLIVEDEPHIAEVVAMQLRFGGLNSIITADAREALIVLADRRVDLIVADVGLPGLSGVDLAHLLCGEPRCEHIPIVLLTGRSEGVSQEAIAGTRVVATILKPFSPRQVLRTVRVAIAESQAGLSGRAEGGAPCPIADPARSAA